MKKIRLLLKKFVKIKKEKVLIPTLNGHFLENRHALITGGGSRNRLFYSRVIY